MRWRFRLALCIWTSKQRLTQQTLQLLTSWAQSCGLETRRSALFAGAKVNHSERRAALHMAARWPEATPAPEGMEAAAAFCQQQRVKMAGLVTRVHQQAWFGATGQAITDIVHIGVGGSDLGPKLVSEALADCPSQAQVGVHYVSTMDGSQLLPLMETLNPATTLLVLASKSFTTADTQFNLRTALTWLSDALEVDEASVRRYQLLGVSSKPEKDRVRHSEAHQLEFRVDWRALFAVVADWRERGHAAGAGAVRCPVGGRARHGPALPDTPLAQNLPVLQALVGAWNCQFLNIPTHAVLPRRPFEEPGGVPAAARDGVQR